MVWGRFARRKSSANGVVARTALSRTGPLSLGLREDLPWLLDRRTADGEALSGAAQEVLACLEERGASFLPDILAGVARLPSEVEDALWQLVAAGRVTADGFGALRGLISGVNRRVRRGRPRLRSRPRRHARSSRWALLESKETSGDVLEERAFQLLRRYGVVTPELLQRETMAPPWRTLLPVFRRAEARGEIRGGRFVAGLVGEQFALPEAVEALRRERRTEASGALTSISACDPLNLAGILTPGPRVPATPGNRVVVRDGVPVASLQGGEVHATDASVEAEARRVLGSAVMAGGGAERLRMFTCLVCGAKKGREELVDEVFNVDGRYVMAKSVPSTVCGRCGEHWFSRETTEKIRFMIHRGVEATESDPKQVYEVCTRPGMLRSRLRKWVMRWLLGYGTELPMGLNDMADLLEACGMWDAFSEKYGITRDDRAFAEDRDVGLDRTVWLARFRSGGESFIAYGPYQYMMPVYHRGDGIHHPKTKLLFPSCMKFLPYAIGGTMVRVKMATIQKRYGRPRGAYGRNPRDWGFEPEETS